METSLTRGGCLLRAHTGDRTRDQGLCLDRDWNPRPFTTLCPLSESSHGTIPFFNGLSPLPYVNAANGIQDGGNTSY